ncbi:YtxH domain-containing protein [Emticicia soli]|uniref:YtxH domain-containing protein n=1 Tax=Emticicia soli TaxID=2027878 RepID=A0ABW5JDM5_9BACT
MKSSKLLADILAGFAAGTFIGILFAPGKGSLIRKQIMNKGEDYADSLKDKMDSLNKKYQNRLQKTKSEHEDGQSKPEDIKIEKSEVSGS